MLDIDIRLGRGKLIKSFSDSISDFLLYKRAKAEMYHVVYSAEDGVCVLHKATIHHAGPKARRDSAFKVRPSEAKTIIEEIRHHLATHGWETLLR